MQLEQKYEAQISLAQLQRNIDVARSDINCNIEQIGNYVSIEINGSKNNFELTRNGVKDAIDFINAETTKYKESLSKLTTAINMLNRTNYNAIDLKPFIISETLKSPKNFVIELPSLHAEVVDYSRQSDSEMPFFTTKTLFDSNSYSINLNGTMNSMQINTITDDIINRIEILQNTLTVNMVEKPSKAMSEMQETVIAQNEMKYLLDKRESWIVNKEIYSDLLEDQELSELTDEEIFDLITADFHKEFQELDVILKDDVEPDIF